MYLEKGSNYNFFQQLLYISEVSVDPSGGSSSGNSPTVSEGSVRLIQEKYAEIWVDGKWSPICGPGFWDNNIGATLFCQKLDQRQWTDTCYTFITTAHISLDPKLISVLWK